MLRSGLKEIAYRTVFATISFQGAVYNSVIVVFVFRCSSWSVVPHSLRTWA